MTNSTDNHDPDNMKCPANNGHLAHCGQKQWHKIGCECCICKPASEPVDCLKCGNYIVIPPHYLCPVCGIQEPASEPVTMLDLRGTMPNLERPSSEPEAAPDIEALLDILVEEIAMETFCDVQHAFNTLAAENKRLVEELEAEKSRPEYPTEDIAELRKELEELQDVARTCVATSGNYLIEEQHYAAMGELAALLEKDK